MIVPPLLQLVVGESGSIRGSVRKMRIYNAKEIPILKSQISQHQLRNLAFSVAQFKASFSCIFPVNIPFEA